ncbi:MAG TPA: hypothetical protein VK249_02605 [Anaerolineales bacterium]|nr:hypothetical protein [Anaerolineales bacterium]
MTEGFYLRFSNASCYEDEGKIYIRLAEPRERVAALLPLLCELIRSATKPDGVQSCPICHRTLEVSFSRYPRISKTITIETHCTTCNITLLFESNKIPPWISEYGSLLEKMRKRES